MGTRELKRYHEIVRRLDRLQKQWKKIDLIARQVADQRSRLRTELGNLQQEKQDLEQGQLLFDDVG